MVLALAAEGAKDGGGSQNLIIAGLAFAAAVIGAAGGYFGARLRKRTNEAEADSFIAIAAEKMTGVSAGQVDRLLAELGRAQEHITRCDLDLEHANERIRELEDKQAGYEALSALVIALDYRLKQIEPHPDSDPTHLGIPPEVPT